MVKWFTTKPLLDNQRKWLNFYKKFSVVLKHLTIQFLLNNDARKVDVTLDNIENHDHQKLSRNLYPNKNVQMF